MYNNSLLLLTVDNYGRLLCILHNIRKENLTFSIFSPHCSLSRLSGVDSENNNTQ